VREYCISSTFLGVVFTARVAFSKRSWPFVPAMVLPWLLCAGQRCLTRLSALAPHRRHLSSYYRFLSDGKFRMMEIHLVSRLRSDARLRSARIPRRPKGKRGRKPKWGPFLPSLGKLARQRRAFQEESVAIYGRTVTLLLRAIVAWWPPLDCLVKVVITRDPRQPRRVAYLMTTDLDLSPVQVVEWFAKRWTVEQLFNIAKNQLGFDSAEVRAPRAVSRHAALTMALVTWVEVWWHQAHPQARTRTFTQKLGTLREQAVREMIFASGPRTRGSRRNARGIASLFRVATAAA
jgi:hypothetical protein